MNFFRSFTAAICVLFSVATIGFAQTDDENKSSKPETESVCKLPEVRKELAQRVAKDQAARKQMIEATQRGKGGKTKIDSKAHDLVASIDKENKTWLEEIVKQHGWPGKTLVGQDGSYNAWLLVQHADQDLPFQKKCLSLMTKMAEGEVTPVNIAYLTDRILSAESKPQRYGTQCRIIDGKAVVKNVEDPESLNDRRKELGLQPIEEYLKFVESMYVKPPADDSQNKDSNSESEKAKKS